MSAKNKKDFWYTVMTIVIVLLVLNLGRIVWLALFDQSESRNAEQGMLDLRDWDAQNSRSITLDGQWEFYPNQFIASKPTEDKLIPQYALVPENWSHNINQEKPTPYGYGSYRLTLLVDAELRQSYTLRVNSVRSASKLYVNGILLAQMGVPAENKESYKPVNIPYSGTFTSDDDGKIEIIIEASNYVDMRGGGLIRSLKLGSEQAIFSEIDVSNSMQQLVASVFLLHALYAIMLFFASPRRRPLLWFALLVISFTILVMVGSEDKQLQVWFGFSYIMGFRFVLLMLALMLFSLYQLIYPFLIARHVKYFYIIQALNGIAILGAIVLPFEWLMLLNNVYTAIIMVIILICVIVFLINIRRGYTLDRIYLVSLLAVANHLLWWFLLIVSGIKILYYPFDLIIAIITFSIMWTRSYIQTSREKTVLAEKLQRSINQRDEFLANTSHELRNPLHSILNIAQVVLDREKDTLSARSAHDLKNVVMVGSRLTLMLNELLDDMSLKGGTLRLHHTRISLHKLATGVQDLLSYMRHSEDVVIINNITRDFPRVWGDENRTIQILYNLLHNALKFTSKGSVTIKAEQKGDYAVISITDTGIGMNPTVHDHIFDPYEQGEAGKASGGGGFGLGLSISKKLIELQGGEIYSSSQPGVGSTFSFTMPLAQEEQQNDAWLTDAKAEGAAKEADAMLEDAANSAIESESELWYPSESAMPTQATEQAKLLLVDDDTINLDILQAILEEQHFAITCTSSVKHALRLIEHEEWDLVISDVMMPEMSGYELTRWIRQRYSLTELPVLLLTARSQSQDLQHAFACGANDYVRKPMDANEVRSRVGALTSVKKTFRERLQMEAAWLQAQIQPHFFFNTINSVIALSEIDLVQMRKLLVAFSTYLQDKFRYSDISDTASIEEELGMVRTYLFIEQARFGDRLQVQWEVDECADLKLPPLTIQPLVENAIRHGLMPRAEGGCVTIQIIAEEHDYLIAVKDNGVGIDERTRQALLQQRTSERQGVGLLNTNRRLQWHYRSGLTIESAIGAGTTISFRVAKS